MHMVTGFYFLGVRLAAYSSRTNVKDSRWLCKQDNYGS